MPKTLLNAAFNGILPSLLLRRSTKGGYDSNGYSGIQANAARLTAMVTGSRLADAGIIDPQPVLEEIARLAAGAPGRMANLGSIRRRRALARLAGSSSLYPMARKRRFLCLTSSTPANRLSLGRHVRITITEYGGMLLDLSERRGRWYALTPAAALWLQRIQDGCTVGQAGQAVADRYKIPLAQAAEDLAPFIAALLQRRILAPVRRQKRVALRWWH